LPQSDPAEDLDGLIRRVDPDRWLASRFIADPAARADVIALYAFDHELARARRVASTPLMAEIRVTWWDEAVSEAFGAGAVRHHPTAEALADAIRRHGLPREAFEAIIAGHLEAVETAELDAATAARWAGVTQGSLARLVAQVLDPSSSTDAAEPAGRAWGLTLLLRAGLVSREVIAPLLRAALEEARVAARALGVAAFPAVLPSRLARFDLADRRPGQLAKRLSLVWASATGRI
jgi:phytoene synthase